MMKLVMIALALAACGEAQVEEVIVKPFRAPCIGVGAQMCLQLEDIETGEARISYDGIVGYTPEWGKTSRLLVSIETVDDPPADGSSRITSLDTILEETRLAEGEFELAFGDVAPGNAWFTGTASPLDMQGTRVECESAVCDAIVAATEETTAFTVTMQITDDGNTLVAAAVE